MKRYAIACRSCDGTGYHDSTDAAGYPSQYACRCRRGKLIILLNEEDERGLLKALQASVNSIDSKGT